MTDSSKRVLVLTSDPALATSRVGLVRAAGFACEVAGTGDYARQLLEAERFHLVLLGREPDGLDKAIERWLHERYPELPTLKVDNFGTESEYASRTTDSAPSSVVATLRAMLGDSSPVPLH